jgi:uncharacterized protein (TIGR00369 family)
MSQTYFGIEIPFIEKMAMDVEKISEDLVHVHLDLQPWQCNSFGVAHGGVMMTLLDFAMAMAAKVKHGHLGGAMTIDMSTSFIKGGKGKIIGRKTLGILVKTSRPSGTGIGLDLFGITLSVESPAPIESQFVRLLKQQFDLPF